MNSFPRRSARLNQQPQNTYTQQGITSIPSFQSYSQPISLSSSSHPSPTNDHISLPAQSQQYSLQLQSQFLAPNQSSSVPLPSPSANDLNPFFSRNQYYNQEMSGQSLQNNNTSSTAQTNEKEYQSQQTQQAQHHHNSFSQSQRSNYPPTSVNGVPPGLPPDFLAEAAKRAQMACLMRDMDDVSL